MILDSNCKVAERYAVHVHCRCAHQGRLITLSQIRIRGVFIIKGQSLISSLLDKCTVCKRLRGATSTQLMADLPPERVQYCAPFDHVGIDVFGPYYVHDGVSTRRTSATKKVFVLIVNCMASRAIHLEPLAGMDTVSMIMNCAESWPSVGSVGASALTTVQTSSGFMGKVWTSTPSLLTPKHVFT